MNTAPSDQRPTNSVHEQIWPPVEERTKQIIAPSCVHERIAEIASRTPERIALRHGGAEITYGEMNARANRLAGLLRSVGVADDVAVGVLLDRGFDQIIALLAVLKACGAFLPVDPAWPAQRVQFVLNDARVPVLISNRSLIGEWTGEAMTVVTLDGEAVEIAMQSADELPSRGRSESLAYLIYTSGSTGQPKGVEITHGNLINLIDGYQKVAAIQATDRASHLAGLAFDACVFEVWPFLAVGASVSVIDAAARNSSHLLQQWLFDESITVAYVPTVLAEALIATDWPTGTALRVMTTGGEALHAYPRADLPFTLLNAYGPTECTVGVLYGPVTTQTGSLASPPLGRPLHNTRIYLLDDRGAPVPDGSVGEIYIAGDSVGRGYRGRADLTGEVFVEGLAAAPGERLYRTGDLGSRLPDGQFAFHGRMDEQVKIRGHRIEPNEIATVLNRHPSVSASVVVASGSASLDRKLIAYVVPSASGEPKGEDLRKFLSDVLPDYMIPSMFVRLPSLPLSGSGKVDKAALPPPGPDTIRRENGGAPQLAIEKRIAEIIASVLKVGSVGLDDNFFLVGGHSLLATQVVLQVRDAFGVDVKLLQLFQAPTVAGLAKVTERLLLDNVRLMTDQQIVSGQRRSSFSVLQN